jgi:hypothetical protein
MHFPQPLKDNETSNFGAAAPPVFNSLPEGAQGPDGDQNAPDNVTMMDACPVGGSNQLIRPPEEFFAGQPPLSSASAGSLEAATGTVEGTPLSSNSFDHNSMGLDGDLPARKWFALEMPPSSSPNVYIRDVKNKLKGLSLQGDQADSFFGDPTKESEPGERTSCESGDNCGSSAET